MTVGPTDAWRAVEAMLQATLLGDRIAIALRYLELRWEFIALDVKRGGGEPNRLLREFVVSLTRVPDTIHVVGVKAFEWLMAQAVGDQDIRDETVLAFLYIVDHLLTPFIKSKTADVLSGAYELAGGDTVHLWIAPKDVLRLLNPNEESLPLVVNPNENYENTVGDLMTSVRHVSTSGNDRQFDVAMVNDEVLAHFDALWSRGEFKGPLRVGLHSLRGPFKPKLSYTRTEKTRGDERSYLFRASDITPLDRYRSEIAAAVSAASDPVTGVQVLVFPEFLMTTDGVKALMAALDHEVACGNEKSLPVLIFAGTSHTQVAGGDFGNCCIVFDRTGRLVWQQLKRIPFGTDKDDKLLREEVDDLPVDAVGDIHLIEDISALGDYYIRRTPVGSFGIAICSDMTSTIERSPALIWSAAPIDFLVIPSYTPSTKRFVNIAQFLNASYKTVLFVNGRGVPYAPQSLTDADDPWGVSPQFFSPAAGEPVLTAFVSTPWTKLLGMWFGDTVRENQTPSFKMLTQNGLSVDLSILLRIVVDA